MKVNKYQLNVVNGITNKSPGKPGFLIITKISNYLSNNIFFVEWNWIPSEELTFRV
jgi:hypothetical protein